MSQKNVEQVRRGIQNVEAFWAMLDEHVVWDVRDLPGPDLANVYVGREEVIDSSRKYWGTWADYSVEAEEILDAGQSVFVSLRERGRGKGSGVPVDRVQYQTWTFRRGRIVRWESYGDRAEALEAVGRSERTSSQDQIEIVRRVFDRWVTGDFGWGDVEVDEHVMLVVPPSFPAFGVFVGQDQISEYWRGFLEQWEHTTFEATRLREAGDTVIVDVTEQGRGKQSGLAAELRFFMLLTFRGRVLVRMDSLMEEGEALAAAGLTPNRR